MQKIKCMPFFIASSLIVFGGCGLQKFSSSTVSSTPSSADLAIPSSVTRESLTRDLEKVVKQEYDSYLSQIHKGNKAAIAKDKSMLNLEQSHEQLLAHENPQRKFALDVSEKGLEDYTQYPFISIDNDDSKDLDQAMYIKKDAGAFAYTVYYAIADADYFLQQAPDIEAKAKLRLFTTYLPFSNYPVLPRSISEGLASLNQDVVRRANLVVMNMDKSGNPISSEFHKAIIKNKQKLSYRGVQDYYDGNPWQLKNTSPEVKSVVDALNELGTQLCEQAQARGQIFFDEKELDFEVTNGHLIIKKRVERQVEKFNAQISIMANAAVGKFLSEERFASVHRIQPSPGENKTKDLEEAFYALSLKAPKATSKDYADTLKKDFGSTEINQVVHDLMVHSLSPAKYTLSSEDTNHFGLGLENYDQFTAPMRRYADVLVARILSAKIEGTEIPYQDPSPEFLNLIERINSAKYREANIAKRVNDYLIAVGMKSQVGKKWTATVRFISQREKTMIVSVDELPFTLPINSDAVYSHGEYVNFGTQSMQISGGPNKEIQYFEIGDKVEILIKGVNPEAFLQADKRQHGGLIIEPKLISRRPQVKGFSLGEEREEEGWQRPKGKRIKKSGR